MTLYNPYIYTKLPIRVALRPEQMDNKLYIHLKENLHKKINNKCYKEYGYIVEIYKIDNIGHGVIAAENFSGSAVFNITFSCKLCRLVPSVQIVCKVDKVTRALMTVCNGPIIVIIVNDKINNDIFFKDNNNIIRYKSETSSKRLEPGDFVVVTILNSQFIDRDTKIKAIGFLDKIASKADVKQYYGDIHENLDENLEILKSE